MLKLKPSIGSVIISLPFFLSFLTFPIVFYSHALFLLLLYLRVVGSFVLFWGFFFQGKCRFSFLVFPIIIFHCSHCFFCFFSLLLWIVSSRSKIPNQSCFSLHVPSVLLLLVHGAPFSFPFLILPVFLVVNFKYGFSSLLVILFP